MKNHVQGQVRAFVPDIKWINKEAKRRHTIAAVVINELVQFAKESGAK